jgi:hypothetical protein
MKKKLCTLSLFCGALLLLTSNNINAQCGVNAVPPNSSGCQFNDRIDFFSINSVASPFSAGCSAGGYGTYTTTPTWTITAGASTSFSANVGNNTVGLEQGFGIWIDLNKDGIYNNTNEQVFNNNAFLVHANTFTLPISVITGTYNLRARCRYNIAQTSACDAITYGEAENYIVQINGQGEALNFDGVNDRVDIGSSLNTILSSSNKITVEAWVKPSTNSGLGCIVSNYNTSNADMQFLLRRDGSTYGFYLDNGGGFTALNSVATVTIGVWQHVAASWDGLELRIYVNGLLSNTKPLAGTNIRSIINPIWIGANQISENFTGSIDEVRIWNKTLCQPEIMNNMSGEIATIAPNLLANYHFNQGIAAATNTAVTTLTDASASALTGTLTNMTLIGATSNWIAPGAVTSGSLVTAFVSPTVAVSGATAICNGASTTFTASGNVSTYTWTPGPPTQTITVNPNVTTTYSVVGTATNGCVSNIATKTLTVNSTPTVAVNSGSICSGNTFTIIPSGASTYTVEGGTTVVTPTANTTYSVTGTSAAGCVSSNTAVSTVSVNALPVVSVNSGSICSGNTFTIIPSGASTYTVEGGTTVVTPTANTTYSVTGTSAVGCVSSNTALSTVSVNALPVVTVNSGSICAGESFTMVPSGANTYTYSNGSSVATPTTNATYTLTGTDSNGCENSVTSSVTVNALPNLIATTNNTLICTGETATLTASGATTYTWNTAETTNGIAVSPTVTTTYTVNGSDANGCSNSTTIVQDVSLCTGINSSVVNQNSEIVLYPNPSIGLFVIEVNSTTYIEVVDVLGKTILKQQLEVGKYDINITDYANGVYFIKTNNGYTYKLVKQN